MHIFDGDKLAAQLEQDLIQQVQALAQQGKQLKIAAILFAEDAGSRLYTRLKKEAAGRVGIEYEVHTFSMVDGVEAVSEKLTALNQDSTVTGIIIQKPWRKTWATVKGITQDQGPKPIRQAFNAWWQYLVTRIDLKKDVDGLHPEQTQILPATAKAVLTILETAFEQLHISSQDKLQQEVRILGRSDIVGLPLFKELLRRKFPVKILNRDDLQQRLNSSKKLLDADIVISATGVKHLVTAQMVKAGSIIIDVGEPRPDVDLESLQKKPISEQPAFITPVPGGVGPMTVVSLLENCVIIATQ